jgi:putative Mg2+ transporter-C (MgtC) family protein
MASRRLGTVLAVPVLADLEWYEVLLRIGVAAVLGGLIGIERELDGQDAGFRTHLLLAVGSALFACASVGGFDRFLQPSADTNINLDVTRIASYIAAGIGFLGGGAIIKSGGAVKGLTTAASIWTVAAIGLAAGIGFWSGAIATTVISLFALALLRPFSRWLRTRARRHDSVNLQVRRSADISELVGRLQQLGGATLREMHIGAGENDDALEIEVQFWAPLDSGLAENLFGELAHHPDVVELHLPG